MQQSLGLFNYRPYLQGHISLIMKLLRTPAIALFLFVCACSKSDPAPPQQEKFSTLLDHFFEIDTTKAPFDTVASRYYFYDASSRLVLDSAMQKAQGGSGTPVYYKTEIHYQGSDTLASWSTSRSWSAATLPYIDTTYYTFVNGRYMKDTIHFDDRNSRVTAEARNRYTYSNNLMTRDFQNWVAAWNYSANEQDTVHFTTVNGDINYYLDQLSEHVNGQSQIIQVFETNISYLPNPNPFFHLVHPIAKPFSFYMGLGEQPATTTSPAKLLSQQSSRDGLVSYQYQFRSDGYPISATRKDVYTGTPTHYRKLVFVYR